VVRGYGQAARDTGMSLLFKEMVTTSNHAIRVEHWTEWLEGCEKSTRHILRVSIEFHNVWGRSTHCNAEAWLTGSILESKILFDNLEEWKADQIPRLAGQVFKMLYDEQRKGTVQNGNTGRP
jgi:hypothetical protein